MLGADTTSVIQLSMDTITKRGCVCGGLIGSTGCFCLKPVLGSGSSCKVISHRSQKVAWPEEGSDALFIVASAKGKNAAYVTPVLSCALLTPHQLENFLGKDLTRAHWVNVFASFASLPSSRQDSDSPSTFDDLLHRAGVTAAGGGDLVGLFCLTESATPCSGLVGVSQDRFCLEPVVPGTLTCAIKSHRNKAWVRSGRAYVGALPTQRSPRPSAYINHYLSVGQMEGGQMEALMEERHSLGAWCQIMAKASSRPPMVYNALTDQALLQGMVDGTLNDADLPAANLRPRAPRRRRMWLGTGNRPIGEAQMPRWMDLPSWNSTRQSNPQPRRLRAGARSGGCRSGRERGGDCGRAGRNCGRGRGGRGQGGGQGGGRGPKQPRT